LYIAPEDSQPTLAEGLTLSLPEGAARHVQVLRLQPGSALRLFDGSGGEWCAEVQAMGKREVHVIVGAHELVSRELPAEVTLAMGVPANERMDTLVEKAAELGVTHIQPLLCERSVVRLEGERAAKRVAHWQAVAIAACEQSGRTRVPMVQAMQSLKAWVQTQTQAHVPPMQKALTGEGSGSQQLVHRGVLSLRQAQWVSDWLQAGRCAAGGHPSSPAEHWMFLSGPEGGLSEAEEDLALRAGWSPVSLGARVLRADTAPMTVMGLVSALYPPS